jgi:ribonuclease HI
MKLIINTDGLSKGNPGTAAIGATIKDERGKTLAIISKRIGITTNNVAEYKALIAALQQVKKMGGTQLEIRADSELMIRQLNGRYKIKSEGLKPLYIEATQLLTKFETVSLKHVPRELNAEADQLANDAVR